MTDPSPPLVIDIPPGVHPLRAALDFARRDAKRRGINDVELARRLDWKGPRLSTYLNHRLPNLDQLMAMEKGWELPRPRGRILRWARYVEDPPLSSWEKMTLARTDISHETAQMLVALSREGRTQFADAHPELVVMRRTGTDSRQHG